MLTPLHPAYPTEEDIQYGLWLKRFATTLPAHAEGCGLSRLQVLEVQSMAAEYLDLLIWQLQYTSAALTQPPAAPAVPLCELLSCHEYTRLVQRLIAGFVAQVQQHPAYTADTGQALQLHAMPLPSR
jgi:hypothetical protein